MKFLIDAQLPPVLADWLHDQGHGAVHVAHVGLLAASDRVIADFPEGGGYILVSKDEDSCACAGQTGSRSYGCGSATRPIGR